MRINILIFLVTIKFATIAQCLVQNSEFNKSYTNKVLLMPEYWDVYGKNIFVYDDSKPYVDKLYHKPHYINGYVISKYDTTQHDILWIGTYINTLNRNDNKSISTKLTEILLKDSIYEISLSFYIEHIGEQVKLKYFPVFLSADFKPTYKLNKLTECKLYAKDSSLIEEGKIYKLKTLYKANGTENYLSLKTGIDYKDILVIKNMAKAKEDNKYGTFIYIDKFCIKPVIAECALKH